MSSGSRMAGSTRPHLSPRVRSPIRARWLDRSHRGEPPPATALGCRDLPSGHESAGGDSDQRRDDRRAVVVVDPAETTGPAQQGRAGEVDTGDARCLCQLAHQSPPARPRGRARHFRRPDARPSRRGPCRTSLSVGNSKRRGDGTTSFSDAAPLPPYDGSLSKRKLPEHVEVVDDFPRTASGKIVKRVLRDRFKSTRTETKDRP